MSFYLFFSFSDEVVKGDVSTIRGFWVDFLKFGVLKRKRISKKCKFKNKDITH